ncbi:dicarboxylate/amino acid:cation symporter [Kroppenstedtia pulmonis]|uniref:Dicarboxylate/amino acid:cation symporter n=1 Tax=Kroppenstedtia pulmonis TaxID=1380685 RepID=A0A7D4B2G9_9BACL|nr:dicarboxylate/amino acid:cation symporter [Kroppenstedtia pulmonis]QKG84386.1 dicarboxylate/amino acid:cation symporter [Kroppenstedtia pulmonis]
MKAYRFPLILLASIVVGSISGFVLGPKAEVVKPLGDIFLNLMFMIVVPLVFVTISSSIAQMTSLKRLGKILGMMLVVFAVTGFIASVFMLTSVNLFNPAEGVDIALEKPEKTESINPSQQIVEALTAPDFRDLLSKENMLALILFAMLFGIAASMSGEAGQKVAKGLSALAEVLLKLVGIIMWYAPIGLGAYFASLIGVFGPQLIGSYAKAVLVYYPTAVLYFVVFFTLYAFVAGGKKAVRKYWGAILTPAATSLATGSSLASIPANLEASKKIGVSRDIREVVVPVGASIHMDGSCLSAILKISFLFGLFQIPFQGVSTYLTAILIALLSGMVMSGVPGGGFIGEMLIMTLYGFPPEALPILAVLGTVVDPPATMVNSTGDTVSGMLLSRLIEGKEWMTRSES